MISETIFKFNHFAHLVRARLRVNWLKIGGVSVLPISSPFHEVDISRFERDHRDSLHDRKIQPGDSMESNQGSIRSCSFPGMLTVNGTGLGLL